MSSIHLLKTRLCLRHFVECQTYTRVTWLRFGWQSPAFSTETPSVVEGGSPSLIGPQPSNMPKNYPVKLTEIVGQISKLTLIEVAELNELLKKTLNIPDVPMMAMGTMPAAAAPVEEEEEEAPKSKTSFTVKLIKYDEAKKVLLIKELKNQIEGMNLVQAKKFVEGTPQNVRVDVGKDEAEKLMATLQAVGGTCEIV